MTPFASRTLALASALACVPALASAQTINLTVNSIGDSTVGSGVTAIANAEDCSGNVNVVLGVTVTSGTTMPTQIDLWRGGEGSTCNTAATRSQTNSPCTHVGHYTVADSKITVPMADLSAVTSGTSTCVPSSADTPGTKFQFFGIGTTANPDLSLDTPYGTFKLTIDAASPTAPTVGEETHFVGGNVSVSWKAPTTSEMITYTVFIDPNGTCDNETPTSSLLRPGMAAPSSATRKVESSGTTATIKPSDANVSAPHMVVVAVATTDLSGNVGVLSPLMCVEFVQTFGFCDGTGAASDCGEDCAVSAPGLRTRHGFLLTATLACAAVLVHTRRRRRAQ